MVDKVKKEYKAVFIADYLAGVNNKIKADNGSLE